MDRYTRWAALLRLLAQQERLTVEDAARNLNVSEATVRRDFEALAKERKIVRVRGAALHSATHAGGAALELSRHSAHSTAPSHVRRLAARAAALIHTGEVVGVAGAAFTDQIGRALGARFDAGATPTALASPDAARAGAASGITVVTNDLAVATELARRPGIKVVATGGVLAPGASTMSGPLVGLLLAGVSLDTAIVTATAVDPEFGVTAVDDVEAQACSQLIARARQVVVVATSESLDRSAFARICGAERIDVLVTDDGVAPATAERFGNRGVRVVTG